MTLFHFFCFNPLSLKSSININLIFDAGLLNNFGFLKLGREHCQVRTLFFLYCLHVFLKHYFSNSKLFLYTLIKWNGLDWLINYCSHQCNVHMHVHVQHLLLIHVCTMVSQCILNDNIIIIIVLLYSSGRVHKVNDFFSGFWKNNWLSTELYPLS